MKAMRSLRLAGVLGLAVWMAPSPAAAHEDEPFGGWNFGGSVQREYRSDGTRIDHDYRGGGHVDHEYRPDGTHVDHEYTNGRHVDYYRRPYSYDTRSPYRYRADDRRYRSPYWSSSARYGWSSHGDHCPPNRYAPSSRWSRPYWGSSFGSSVRVYR
jgi:hypothetical protein